MLRGMSYGTVVWLLVGRGYEDLIEGVVKRAEIRVIWTVKCLGLSGLKILDEVEDLFMFTGFG